MGKAEGGKESPGVGFRSPPAPVIAECHEDGGKVVVGHGGPIEGQVGVHNFKRRDWQTVEEKAGDHPEISSAPAAAGAKEIGIMVLVHVPARDMTFVVDGEDLNCGKPIDGETVEPREHTIAAAGDVSAGAHFVAAATGHGYTVALVQIDVGFAQFLSGADAIAGSVAGQACMIHQAQIEDRTTRVVDHEVLIAVAAAAHGWAFARTDHALQGFCCLLGCLAQFNLGCRVGFIAVPAKVAAALQHCVARIGARNPNGHPCSNRKGLQPERAERID